VDDVHPVVITWSYPGNQDRSLISLDAGSSAQKSQPEVAWSGLGRAGIFSKILSSWDSRPRLKQSEHFGPEMPIHDQHPIGFRV